MATLSVDTDFAAVGDGTTDDTTHFANAITQLTTNGGGTLVLGDKTYLIKTAGNGFALPSNCKIVGVPGKTTLLLDNAAPSTSNPPYGGIFTITGVNNVLLQDFTIKRNSAVLSNLLLIDACSNITFRNLTLNGQMATFAGNALCHGLRYGNTGGAVTNVSNIVIEGCEFFGLSFGLYMTNASTASVYGFSVRDNSFHDNFADDVNFNAPLGTFVFGQVTGNRFKHNLSTSNVGGFAVDLANVQYVVISNNIIDDYPYNGVHLEDRTAHVSVTDNILRNCAKTDESVVQIVAGVTFVTVSGNCIDQSGTTPSGTRQSTAAVYIGPGGGTTSPDRITVTSNTFKLGSGWDGISAFSVPRLTINGNHFEGSGTGAWNGTYSGGGNSALDIINGGPVSINGNYCFGMESFIKGSASAFRTPVGSIAGNTIEQCHIGMKLQPAGNSVVGLNYFSNCEFSINSGSNGVTVADRAVIAFNLANGSTNDIQTTYGNFWGGTAETQRLVVFNCDTKLGAQGFPVQGFFCTPDKLAITADANATTDTFYYSTSRNQPVYKDGTGSVHGFYVSQDDQGNNNMVDFTQKQTTAIASNQVNKNRGGTFAVGDRMNNVNEDPTIT
jgi:hypothetical protein